MHNITVTQVQFCACVHVCVYACICECTCMCVCAYVAPAIRTHTNGRMFGTCPPTIMCKDVRVTHNLIVPRKLLLLFSYPEFHIFSCCLSQRNPMQFSNFGPKIWIFLKSSLSLGMEEGSLLSAPEPTQMAWSCSPTICFSLHNELVNGDDGSTFVPQCPAKCHFNEPSLGSLCL